MVRKRPIKISVFDYPEHLNPFREEEEEERRLALLALEGRTTRCHLLGSPGREDSAFMTSPVSSGVSTPVNGTLRRRMKKRKAPPPPVPANSTSPNEPASEDFCSAPLSLPTMHVRTPVSLVTEGSPERDDPASKHITELPVTNSLTEPPENEADSRQAESPTNQTPPAEMPPGSHTPPDTSELLRPDNSNVTVSDSISPTADSSPEISSSATAAGGNQRLSNDKTTQDQEISSSDIKDPRLDDSNAVKEDTTVHEDPEINVQTTDHVIKTHTEAEQITEINDANSLNQSEIESQANEIETNITRTEVIDVAMEPDTSMKEDQSIEQTMELPPSSVEDSKESQEKPIITTSLSEENLNASPVLPYIDQDSSALTVDDSPKLSNGHCNGSTNSTEPKPSPRLRRPDKYTTQVSHVEIRISDIAEV